MNHEYFRQIFEKSSYIKFNYNPSSGSRADGRTDMTKLIVVFRNFANAPNKESTRPYPAFELGGLTTM
jgi:hypothetical protein